MYIRLIVQSLPRVLIPIAVLSTIYLYLYPIFHGCAFPSTNGSAITAFTATVKSHVQGQNKERNTVSHESLAPFRILVLADPQLEGDTSLPDPEDAFSSRLVKHWDTIKKADTIGFRKTLYEALHEILTKDIATLISEWRKRIDLFGNDYYLAHIYRTLHWWSRPTHVTVLGDLVGSQWVTNEEFKWRGWRYWNRVFAGGTRVSDNITSLDMEQKERVFEMNDENWKTRIINIAGNHDIGYAGDISRERIDRFEQVFGKANWDVRFEYDHDVDVNTKKSNQTKTDVKPSVHLVVLNDLNLDTPALSEEIQGETYEYLNSIITKRIRPVEDDTSFLLLLTHVPLYKREGICVDGPFFDFWGDDDGGGVYRPGGLKEQNHLSQHASQPGTLESLFGMSGNLDVPAKGKGRPGLILTGHDHEGCDTWHFIPTNSTSHWDEEKQSQEGEETNPRKTQWSAMKYSSSSKSSSTQSHTGIREITLRSMMGEFGGNAGLLSLWYDFSNQKWSYNFQSCRLGVQHIWWTIHVLDIITLVITILNLILQRIKSIPKSNLKTEEEQLQPKKSSTTSNDKVINPTTNVINDEKINNKDKDHIPREERSREENLKERRRKKKAK